MKTTNFLIREDGTVDYKATGCTAADLYGSYDSASWRIHFSETVPAKQVQMETLKDLFEKATANSKRPEEVSQNSANTFAYRLYTDSDTENADKKRQAAYEKMVADAYKISEAIKQNNGNSQSGNSQNNGSQNNQNGNGGQSQNSGNQNGSQNNGNSQSGNNQSNSQNNQNGNGGQPPQFDRTIDILTGRPIKERYPELFWDCTTKEEEEKKYDEYWKVYQEVTDLFAK